MYKLLIVEDEKWEREGLRNLLDWENMGIKVVGCACNGVEGIKMAQVYRPDIILTDIIMPIIDGIQMSRNIRTFLPDTAILIISGYDEFQYAKKSFDFNAFAYILKPIQKKNLEDILENVLEILDDKKITKRKKNLLESQWKDYICTGQDHILIDFLEYKIELKHIIEFPPMNKLKVSGKKVVVILTLYIDSDKCTFEDSLSDDFRQKLLKLINNMLGERGIAVFRSEFQKELVICMEAYFAIQQLETDLYQMIDGLKEKLGIQCIAGIGGVVNNLASAPKSYSQAREAIGFRFLAKFGELLFYTKIINIGRDNRSLSGQLFEKSNLLSRKIVHNIQKGNMCECIYLVDNFIALLRKDMFRSKILLNCFLMDIINGLNMLLSYNSDKSTYVDFWNPQKPGVDFSMLDSLSQTRKYIIDFLNSVAVNTKISYCKGNVVQRILEIIEERYSEKLELKRISEEIHLSPYYIGSIFKEYTGKNFNQYLNDYRIDKAKELLQFKNMKVSYLAEKVGIPNPSYFCSLFKNKFGISPGEYKKIVDRRYKGV